MCGDALEFNYFFKLKFQDNLQGGVEKFKGVLFSVRAT